MLAEKEKMALFLQKLDATSAPDVMRGLKPLFRFAETNEPVTRPELSEAALADAFRNATLRTPANITLIEMRRLAHISEQQAALLWERTRQGMRPQPGCSQLEGPIFDRARASAADLLGLPHWHALRRVMHVLVFRRIPAWEIPEAIYNMFEVATCWTAFAIRRQQRAADTMGPLFRIVSRLPFVVTYANEWNGTPENMQISLTCLVH